MFFILLISCFYSGLFEPTPVDRFSGTKLKIQKRVNKQRCQKKMGFEQNIINNVQMPI